MRSLTVEPLIPLALWLALVAASFGVLVWYGLTSRRRTSGARRRAILALMVASFALPLTILLNPTWTEQLPPPAGKPLVTLLVDQSSSMGTRDASGQPRLEAARLFAEKTTRELSDRYEVRTLAFDETTHGVETSQLATLAPKGEVTDLARALHDGVDDDRPQGQFVVLVSDGIHNAMGGLAEVLEATNRARALSAPIYTKSIGGDATVRDIEARFVTPQELAFVGSTVSIAAKLSQHGVSGASTRVTLTLDGKEIESRKIELTSQQDSTLIFELKPPTTGLYRYELAVDPVTGEATPLNNHATLLLRVVDQPIRVLLLEGKPYWDTRFLLRTLLNDASLELDSVVRMADRRLLQQTYRTADEASPPGEGSSTKTSKREQQWKIVDTPSVFLSSPQSLSGYQIVVLGRDADVFLDDTAIANLKTWMTRAGGSLVCFRGAPTAQANQQLQSLLPVRFSSGRESRFRMNWTERGRQMNWLPETLDAAAADPLAQMPSLATTMPEKQPKPLAIVLASAAADGGTAQPVITYQPIGSGRAIVVEGAGMWRWAFLTPEHQGHASVYASLWRSLTRWLVAQSRLLPGQDRLLRTDKVLFDIGENASAIVQIREEALTGDVPQVELIAENQATRIFVPSAYGDEAGTFRVAFGQLAAGRYQARIQGAESNDPAQCTSFDVRPPLAEQLEVRARPDLLEQIAQRSGGDVVDGDDARQFAHHLDEHLRRLQPLRMQTTPAWDRWWVLVGVCGVWAAAWALRRSSGLV